jgi:hypothetical protein
MVGCDSTQEGMAMAMARFEIEYTWSGYAVLDTATGQVVAEYIDFASAWTACYRLNGCVEG